jgi:hypothetical protein
MFWPVITCAYLLAGMITAGVTLTVFPPVEGFHPRPGIIVLALITFTLLWPVLVGLALWYALVSYSRRRELADRPPAAHLARRRRRMTISKPR